MSEAEETLAGQIRMIGLPAPDREYAFAPPRRWRFDFAWPAARVACEVEGGTWVGGRHTTGGGFAADCTKYNTATLAGWRVLRVTGDQVVDGQALGWIQQALQTGEAT